MKLNIQCPVNKLSYGIMSCNILKGLVDKGVDVTLFPIGPVDVPGEIIKQEEIARLVNKQADSFVDNDSLRIYHQFSLAERIGNGRHFGYTTFELDQFTDREKNHLRSCYDVITASRWGSEVLDKNGINGTWSPLGVDRSIFYEGAAISPANSLRDSKDKYIFLHVGKFEKRKGTLEIISAFEHAFNRSDDVELWLCCNNYFTSEKESGQLHEICRNSPLRSKIKLIFAVLETQHDIAQIMLQADCGVFPSRSEGFGLSPLEMMSCGKDVILTDYSGHTEYANNENSWLVPIKELEIASDNKFFKNNIGKWAKIGFEEIIITSNLMKYIHQNREKTKVTEAIKTAKAFSWENTTKKILEIIREG